MRILFRADADTEIGMGHVMRCLALAHASQSFGEIAFVTTSLNKSIEQRLKLDNVSVFQIDALRGSQKDARETIRWVDDFKADWLVLDGYQFVSGYQQLLHANSIKTLLIDDMGKKGRYRTELILNQNIYAHDRLYDDREPYSKLLLGCKYTLLRKEFAAWRNWEREIPVIARRILVTLGGSDKTNMTTKVIDCLDKIKRSNIEVTVIAGQLNPHYQELIARIDKSDRLITLKTDIKDMPRYIAHADLVIAAGGSTCYELAFMATPFVTIVLAENQSEIAKHFANNGISIDMGWYEYLTSESLAEVITEVVENKELRYKMSHKGKDLIDGYGAVKVANAMANYNI